LNFWMPPYLSCLNPSRTIRGDLLLEQCPNDLIMVSGREINTLNGLETDLRGHDEVAIVPIAHGGSSSDLQVSQFAINHGHRVPRNETDKKPQSHFVHVFHA